MEVTVKVVDGFGRYVVSVLVLVMVSVEVVVVDRVEVD